jgi:hypothetical protein
MPAFAVIDSPVLKSLSQERLKRSGEDTQKHFNIRLGAAIGDVHAGLLSDKILGSPGTVT